MEEEKIINGEVVETEVSEKDKFKMFIRNHKHGFIAAGITLGVLAVGGVIAYLGLHNSNGISADGVDVDMDPDNESDDIWLYSEDEDDKTEEKKEESEE